MKQQLLPVPLSPHLCLTLLGVGFACGSFEDGYQQAKSFCSTRQNGCGSSASWDVLGAASQSQWFLLHFCFSLQSYDQGSPGRRKTFPGTSSSTPIVSLNPQVLFWLPLPPALIFYTFTPLRTYSAKAGTSLSAFLKCSCYLVTTELFLSKPEPVMLRVCR